MPESDTTRFVSLLGATLCLTALLVPAGCGGTDNPAAGTGTAARSAEAGTPASGAPGGGAVEEGSADTSRDPDAPFDQQAWLADLQAWHESRLRSLKSDSGWLTLVGLHWLEPGDNTFGSDPKSKIMMTGDGVPAHAGVFTLEGDTVSVTPAEGSGLLVNETPLTERKELKADVTGEPDLLELSGLTFYVIERGQRSGIRVKDPHSPTLAAFTGLDYFPPSPDYRVVADFIPYAEPKTISVPTVLGTIEPMKATGYVRFSIHGQEATLQPVVEGDDAEEMFFIFKDGTSGTETYPAGRFLYTDMPKNGRVVLDFNTAYNPPCAFTSFATCPLPPKENILAMKIEAGEKRYGEH